MESELPGIFQIKMFAKYAVLWNVMSFSEETYK